MILSPNSSRKLIIQKFARIAKISTKVGGTVFDLPCTKRYISAIMLSSACVTQCVLGSTISAWKRPPSSTKVVTPRLEKMSTIEL